MALAMTMAAFTRGQRHSITTRVFNHPALGRRGKGKSPEGSG
jgi:hypothetical protein